MKRLTCTTFATAAALLVLCAQALAGGLPSVGSGHRPGPDALYGPPGHSPLLDNAAPWKAQPILVSGTRAYRDGEYLYQDYLYDDHGATGSVDNNSPYSDNADLFSPPAGTFTYPTNKVYANNSADLVEFRVKSLADATAFRVTLNTLKDASRVAFTVAIGPSDSAFPWPSGAGVSSQAAYFLTVHGSTADWQDASADKASAHPPVSVDGTRRQFDVRVPKSLWNPGVGVVRMTIGVGLWDPKANAYLSPQSGSATEDGPGGGPGPAIVNVGPRFDEPMPDVDNPAPTYTLGDSAAGAQVQAAWWREHEQATALAQGDVSEFHADVDFGKLAANANDDSAIPKTGFMNRILVSRYNMGQGYDPDKICFDLGSSFSAGAKCVGRMVGQLQPYMIYVPKKPAPASGYGMTLLLHSLSANYNQYTNSNNGTQLGDRNGGSIVVTPSGRGPDGFYAGIAEADTFEVWADVARLYKLDPAWSVVSGYSMGGFGTYRLLARWPDLFARGFSVVGAPGSVDDQVASLRNTPLFLWNATADELVNLQTSEEALQADVDAGLRVTEWLFLTADHLTLATNDQYGPGAEWLANARVELNPAHVTYVVDPTEDNGQANSIGDHAYWASGLRLRDPKGHEHTGVFDARSEAFGVGDPKPSGVEESGGTLEGGSHGPMPYAERKQEWGPTPKTPVADRLDVNATNIGAATVDARRARLSCAPQLNVKSDGPLDLKIDCGPPAGAVKGASCSSRVKLRLPRVRGQRVVKVVVLRGHKRLRSAKGRNLRKVSFRRPTRKAFKVRVRIRTSGKGGHARRITLVRRFAAC